MSDRPTRLLPVLSESEKASTLASMGLDADRDPLTLTAAEKSAAANPGLPAPSQEPHMEPVTSPTGAPVVSGTSLALKIAAAVVAVAGVVLVSDFFPQTDLDEKIAGAIVSIGTVLGIASPGLRKK